MIRMRHTNINSRGCGLLTADRAAPGEGAPLPSSSGAADARSPVALPDPYGLYLAIIAAHDRCSREDFIQGAICRRLDEIGISRALDLAEGAACEPLSALPGISPTRGEIGAASAVEDNREPKKGREGVPSGLLPVPRAPP